MIHPLPQRHPPSLGWLALASLLAAGCTGPQGIAGLQGPPGDEGPTGQDGTDGQGGADGKNGLDGADGLDGSSLGTLQGQVTSSAGAPVQDALLTLSPWDYVVESDGDGRYAFAGLPAGDYDGVVSADGYSDTSFAATVEAGAVSRADIVMTDRRGDIGVLVTDAALNPLGDISVTLRQWDWAADGWVDVAIIETAPDGTVSFPSLLDGYFALRADDTALGTWLPTDTRHAVRPGQTVSLAMSGNPYGSSASGSTTCLLCHDGGVATDSRGWRATLHSLSARVPGVEGSLQDGSAWPDRDGGLDTFVPGNAYDNTGAGDAYGQVVTVAENGGYKVWLGVDGDGYFAQFSNSGGTTFSERYDVVLTLGGLGKWLQRYLVRLDQGDWSPADAPGAGVGHVPLPVEFHDQAEGTGDDPRWAAWEPERWQAPAAAGGSAVDDGSMDTTDTFEASCAGCHVNRLSIEGSASAGFSASSNGDVGSSIDLDGDGQADAVDIGCENCHGPGGSHYGTLTGIVNPARLTAAAADLVCARCHSRGESVDPAVGTDGWSHPWAWNEAQGGAPLPGVDESLAGWLTSTPDRWAGADGAPGIHSRSDRQQADDYAHSVHADNPFVRLTCSTCHDLHGTTNPGQVVTRVLRRDADGDRWFEGVSSADNTLCLACHAGTGSFTSLGVEDVQDVLDGLDDTAVAEAVVSHMDYQVGMGGVALYDPGTFGFGSCVACHMPRTARQARWTRDGTDLIHGDLHDHTFVPVLPSESAATAALGHADNIPNSCGSCHDEYRY